MSKKRVILGSLIVALLIAVAGYVVSSPERQKVLAAYEQLRQACEDERYDAAYQMMTRDYRSRVSFTEFEKEFSNPVMFKADGADRFVFNRCRVWSESGWLQVGYTWTFKKEDGNWRCDGHDDTWFVD